MWESHSPLDSCLTSLHLVREGSHGSVEGSDEFGSYKSSEFTDVEETDAQGSSVNSSKQSASAKVSCCVSFP